MKLVLKMQALYVSIMQINMLIFLFKTFSYRTLDESEFSPFLHSTSLSCRSLKKQKFGAKECKAKKCAFPQQCHRISQPIYQSQLTGLSIVTRHFLQILLNYKPFEACRGYSIIAIGINRGLMNALSVAHVDACLN